MSQAKKGEVSILIKRSIAEHGLPEEGLEVMTDKGRGKYYFKIGGWHTWDETLQDFTQAKETIFYWYEPLSLPQLLEEVMPSEKAFSDWADRLEGELMGGDCRRIIEYFESHIKTKLNSK